MCAKSLSKYKHLALAANRLTEMKLNIFEIERKADRISKNQNIEEKRKLLLKYVRIRKDSEHNSSEDT